MIPKEKAKELVFRFRNTMEFSTPPRFSKQSALIAVDEILNAHLFDEDEKEYWQQVKLELQSL